MVQGPISKLFDVLCCRNPQPLSQHQPPKSVTPSNLTPELYMQVLNI